MKLFSLKDLHVVKTILNHITGPHSDDDRWWCVPVDAQAELHKQLHDLDDFGPNYSRISKSVALSLGSLNRIVKAHEQAASTRIRVGKTDVLWRKDEQLFYVCEEGHCKVYSVDEFWPDFVLKKYPVLEADPLVDEYIKNCMNWSYVRCQRIVADIYNGIYKEDSVFGFDFEKCFPEA